MNKKFYLYITAVLSAFFVFTATACGNTDYSAIINRLTMEKMSANLVVQNRSTDLYGYEIMQGSGAIIAKEPTFGGYEYYFLTNNHVVKKHSEHAWREFTVTDYLDREYIASLIYASPDFDLALLKFSASEEFAVVELASGTPSGKVFAVGQPHGQHNAITIGVVTGILPPPVTDDSESNIKFNVIVHDAYITNGSSGGMLLDKDLFLAGINYAGGLDENGEFACAYAVPVSEIRKFLALCEDYAGLAA